MPLFQNRACPNSMVFAFIIKKIFLNRENSINYSSHKNSTFTARLIFLKTMEEIVAEIRRLFFSFKQMNEDRIEKLPQSGSDRIYFRIYFGDETHIATFNHNIKENETFIYFSHHFKN